MNTVSGSEIKGQIAKLQEDAEKGIATAITGHGRTRALIVPPNWEWLYTEETQRVVASLCERYNVDSEVELFQILISQEPIREILAEIKAIKNALNVG
jgi:antitoxin (DNA-binding transcriptional repressor) of toxin-antitoxin stability system